ncbi:hypothetical protein CEUSTIGMA_g12723.t1 [Chlamydomonas eustigma]|uniref:Uncharacterized protein n=1 Tax=Chlamydomonas eustigma TaxID=1157962 RepID=A0A250XQI2_9CHLO|nr:hypothetical protein CEUSTIGMA_g12723.t1 [Chlamydomonas eustigma]|eukprot:GAX85306.1 hypothetical protein CEUSTIGMA_g12723.t1 [Chlamydomonas eustigma]
MKKAREDDTKEWEGKRSVQVYDGLHHFLSAIEACFWIFEVAETYRIQMGTAEYRDRAIKNRRKIGSRHWTTIVRETTKHRAYQYTLRGWMLINRRAGRDAMRGPPIPGAQPDANGVVPSEPPPHFSRSALDQAMKGLLNFARLNRRTLEDYMENPNLIIDDEYNDAPADPDRIHALARRAQPGGADVADATRCELPTPREAPARVDAATLLNVTEDDYQPAPAAPALLDSAT